MTSATPFDLDAVLAESAESTPPPFEFTLGGETFTMPTAFDIDIVLIESLDGVGEGKALRLLLGEDQWATLEELSAEGHKMTGPAVSALLKAWRDDLGGTLGESSASASS